jgi:hypothetical protein
MFSQYINNIIIKTKEMWNINITFDKNVKNKALVIVPMVSIFMNVPLNNFFGPKFLPQTPYVLICLKCMNVTRTKCPIIM